ncbi:hypothetical protein M513_11451 [Trichuris suis]|uniref:Uncharacterized protein n=1 Tax=Trichuris suis TaxID=68888 RepID=A0A085LRR4_9BILA|nr:hypothetical protein M513_11451 [Trichuris suis]
MLLKARLRNGYTKLFFFKCFAVFTTPFHQATFININAKLSGLFWARHQREVCRSPARSLCLQAPPSDRLRQGPQLSALTLSCLALVTSSVRRWSERPTDRTRRRYNNEMGHHSAEERTTGFLKAAYALGKINKTVIYVKACEAVINR